MDIRFEHWISFNTNKTRRHSLKFDVYRSRLDARKHYIYNRVIKMWNNLPESVVSLNSLEKFKDSINSLDLRPYCRERAFTP